MNQESLQSWTLQQELEEAGGLPLTHNTFFQEGEIPCFPDSDDSVIVGYFLPLSIRKTHISEK